MQGASRTSLAEAREVFEQVTSRMDQAGFTDLADELFALVRLLDREHGLRRSLSDPATPRPAKAGLVNALFGNRLTAASVEVIGALVAGRWSRSVDLVDAVEQLGVQGMFRVAELAEALDNVEDQLFRFGRILEREPQLWGVLADRGVAASRKVELLQALLASKVDAVTLRLVELVVTQPRGRAIDAAVEELARLAAERQRRLIAIVQAAVDLTARERTQLSARLKEIYGHDVRLQVEIVPDVLGGLTIRVGDELIDGSIASRLEAARRRLAR